MPIQKTINFVRSEGLNDTTIAILTVILTGQMDDEEVIESIDTAVTKWVKETEEGKDAWEESVHDFNIGDLSNYEDSESLRSYLQDQGILSVDINSSDSSNAFNYDRVFGNL